MKSNLINNIINSKYYLRYYFRRKWIPQEFSIQQFLKKYSESNNEISFIQVGANDGLTNDPYNKFTNVSHLIIICT
jgi:hypothetical protein